MTVYNAINDLAPTRHINRPDFGASKTVISYHFFNEGFGNYGDGLGISEGGSLQVDIFSKVDYTDIVKQVKKRLINKKFRFAGSYDTDDTVGSTNLYHKVLTFNYSESEVKNV